MASQKTKAPQSDSTDPESSLQKQTNSSTQEDNECAEVKSTDLPSDAVSKPTTNETPHEAAKSKQINFPVVGIGASGGGLEAFTRLLKHLPVDTGMAFVLVQHLSPTHESMLTEILSRVTAMPVKEVRDDMLVEANQVYIIPPNTNMAISHGALRLVPLTTDREQHMPIDYFFRSLAAEMGSRAIGVILSGSASDGALGLKAIKVEGGITYAQNESTAKFFGMPHSAIAVGCVDFVLPPEEIARELTRIGRHPFVNLNTTQQSAAIPSTRAEELNQIVSLIRRATGVDFTHYKHSTIKRRIARRMILCKINALGDYIEYLRKNPKEVEDLYHDILICVTNFFREPEAFQALVDMVFPSVMENRSSDAPIRIWVPGCSTGEEAYSIAICLLEYLGDKAANTPIQIFGTDISQVAIAKARQGIYLENIALHVSPERLNHFFVKVEAGYQIRKPVRGLCIFAQQNVVTDPPFSRLDLISCRNVLIYLESVLQKRVMQIFHYALKPSGFLILGNTETVGGSSELFTLVDRKYRIYSPKTTMPRLYAEFSAAEYPIAEVSNNAISKRASRDFDVQKEADKIVLNKYAPAGVIINENLDILQFRGRTGLYLEPPEGAPSLNLLKMAREGLEFDLRTALHRAQKEKKPVRKEGVLVRSNGGQKPVNLDVTPIKIPNSIEHYFLVLFEASQSSPKPPENPIEKKPDEIKGKEETPEIEQLKHELAGTKEYLQSIIEEQEATNEELKSANEEIQSSNEELQSTNEELETAKEELQATNEELTTVNEELANQNEELRQLNNDLTNLLNNISVPILILGSDLHIRHFTPMAKEVLNVISTDVGRKISDIKPNVNIPDLEKLVLRVIDTLSPFIEEVQDSEGHWYSLRIRPYRTMENRIEGAVLTLVDINALKQNNRIKEEAAAFAKAIVDTVREPLVILDAQLRVVSANRSFYNTFQVSEEETESQLIYELGNGQWNIQSLRELLEHIIPQNSAFDDFEIAHDFPSIGFKKMRLNARQIVNENIGIKLILLAIEEITEQK